MTPSAQLAQFIARYSPEIAKRARAILAAMRRRLPGAVELVYDNYNALVIAFGPNERATDVVCSIALYPKWITMFFLHGARLPDPTKRLRGDGKQVRGIQLDGPETLDEPDVRALLSAALANMRVSIDPKAKRRLQIRAVVAKQRPRRPVTSPRPRR